MKTSDDVRASSQDQLDKLNDIVKTLKTMSLARSDELDMRIAEHQKILDTLDLLKDMTINHILTEDQNRQDSE